MQRATWGSQGGRGGFMVMLAARVSAPEAGSLVFTHQGKAGVHPVSCAFKLSLLAVRRSKKERRLFPRIPKDTHRTGPAGGAWQRNRI